MRGSSAFAAVAGAVAAATAAPARAERAWAESIEWRTADSELVVHGKVTAVTKHRYVGGDTAVYQVTFAVTETIKGPPQRSVKLAVIQTYDTPLVAPAGKHDLLLFLVAGERRKAEHWRFAKTPYAPRPADGSIHKLDAGDEHHAYSVSFAVLDDREEILAAARAAAASTATTSHVVQVPRDAPAAVEYYSGSAPLAMRVPVDAQLEQHAYGWLASKDPALRVEGLAALAHFRTPANVLMVATALADPSSERGNQPPGDNPVRRFLVQARAHQVLDAWGVPHTTPALEVSVAP